MHTLKVTFNLNQNAVDSVIDRIEKELQRSGEQINVSQFGRVIEFEGTKQDIDKIKALLVANTQIKGTAIETVIVDEFSF